jgi:hypothetical protein
MGQRGSATLLAVCVFFMLVILIGGMYTLTRNETRLTAKTSDYFQAQYAAEGGVKRAAAEFSKIAGYDWTWLDPVASAAANWNDYTDSTQQYHVSVALASSPNTKITPPTTSPATVVVYRVTAVGKVGNTERTIMADITVSPPINKNSAFTNTVSTDDSTNFIGDAAKGSTVNVRKVVSNGPVTNLTDPDQQSDLGKDPSTKITIPPFSEMVKIREPVKKPLKTIESLDKNWWTKEGNTYIFKENAKLYNMTLIVKGDVKFESASIQNANIFVDGKITINPSLNFNDANLIVAKGDIDNKDNNNLDGVFVSYGTFTGPCNLNKGCLVAYKANITGDSNMNFNEENVQNALVGGSDPIVDIANWRLK